MANDNPSQRWHKGMKSPNPTGRNPLGLSITPCMRHYAEIVPPFPNPKTGKMENQTFLELAVAHLWYIAVYGDPSDAVSAFKVLNDRMEGRLKEAIDLNAMGDVTIHVVYGDNERSDSSPS